MDHLAKRVSAPSQDSLKNLDSISDSRPARKDVEWDKRKTHVIFGKVEHTAQWQVRNSRANDIIACAVLNSDPVAPVTS